MELKKIELSLPTEILSLNERIKHIIYKAHGKSKDQFAIAGGCISNVYMNKPFHDIDVFVQFELGKENEYPALFKQAFGEDIEIESHEMPIGLYTFVECPLLFRFSYQGIPVEIIFCTDLDRIYDFDIRLRQFYFMNDEVLTTELALEDIAQKRLAIAAPCSPITTFIRMHHFKEELGFEIDEESNNLLLWFMSKTNFEYDRVIKTIEKRKKMNPKAKTFLQDFFKSHKQDVYGVIEIPEPTFPFNPHALAFFEHFIRSSEHNASIKRNLGYAQLGVIGKNFERLKTFQPGFSSYEMKVELPKTSLWEMGIPVLSALHEYMKKKRLEVLFSNHAFSYFDESVRKRRTLSTEEYQELYFYYLDQFETPTSDTVQSFSKDLKNREKPYVCEIFGSFFEQLFNAEETKNDRRHIDQLFQAYKMLNEPDGLLNLHVTSDLRLESLSEQLDGGASIEVSMVKKEPEFCLDALTVPIGRIHHSTHLCTLSLGTNGVTKKDGYVHTLLAPLVEKHVSIDELRAQKKIS